MANPFKSASAALDRPIPPSNEAERVRFWIDRGNSLLAEMGRRDVEWVHRNGHYSIEPVRQFGAAR